MLVTAIQRYGAAVAVAASPLVVAMACTTSGNTSPDAGGSSAAAQDAAPLTDVAVDQTEGSVLSRCDGFVGRCPQGCTEDAGIVIAGCGPIVCECPEGTPFGPNCWHGTGLYPPGDAGFSFQCCSPCP